MDETDGRKDGPGTCPVNDCCLEDGHDGPHKYKCAGPHCPGLPWKASDLAHPSTCAYREGDEEYPVGRAPYRKPEMLEVDVAGLTAVDEKWERCLRNVETAREEVREARRALRAMSKATCEAIKAVAKLGIALQQVERAAGSTNGGA